MRNVSILQYPPGWFTHCRARPVQSALGDLRQAWSIVSFNYKRYCATAIIEGPLCGILTGLVKEGSGGLLAVEMEDVKQGVAVVKSGGTKDCAETIAK